MTFTFNNIDVTQDVINSNYAIRSEKNINTYDNLIVSEFQLTLHGIQYNPFKTNSIFYQANNLFKNYSMVVNLNGIITTAVINNIDLDKVNDNVTLTLTPSINNKLNNSITYVAYNQTPAKVLKDVLITAGLLQYVDEISFSNAEFQQENANLYCDFVFDNLKIIDIANTCGELSCADVFIDIDNKIYFKQFNSTVNITNTYLNLTNNEVINYKISQNPRDILNAYKITTPSIEYENYLLGLESINNYGKLVKELNFNNNNGISSSQSGIYWAGDNYIFRCQNPKWILECECADTLNNPANLRQFFQYTELNNLVYEITKIEQGYINKTIKLTGSSL
jgi:hypothetical protein